MQAGNPKNRDNLELPTVATFRAWLATGIREVGVSAYALSKSSGLSQNTVGRFLGSESDICLGSAAALERELRDAASRVGKDLPSLVCGEVRP